MSTQELARAAQSQHDKATILARLKAKKPLESSYNVVVDPAAVEAWEKAKEDLDDARSRAGRGDKAADSELPKARAALDQAEPAMRDGVVILWLRGLPHHAFEQMKNDHPPTDEQREAGAEWDPRALRPHLVAASLFDPDTGEGTGWTAGDVENMASEWTTADYESVYNHALLVNLRVRTVDIPKGSGSTRS